MSDYQVVRLPLWEQGVGLVWLPTYGRASLVMLYRTCIVYGMHTARVCGGAGAFRHSTRECFALHRVSSRVPSRRRECRHDKLFL